MEELFYWFISVALFLTNTVSTQKTNLVGEMKYRNLSICEEMKYFKKTNVCKRLL